METNNINAYILTGGSSIRFGVDKASYCINETSFLDQIYKNLQSDFKTIYSVGKKSYSERVNFIQDFSYSQAAIVGIISALRHSIFDWSFIISVDMPLITSEVVNALIKENNCDNNNLIIPTVNKKLYPLFGFYHQDCLIHLENAYSVKNYILKDVLRSLTLSVIDLSHYYEELTNVNTREHLNIVKKNLS
jgi:molybdopterin-guanine dinucleotide biosynthesis protein A